MEYEIGWQLWQVQLRTEYKKQASECIKLKREHEYTHQASVPKKIGMKTAGKMKY